jgi:hypothetical protein
MEKLEQTWIERRKGADEGQPAHALPTDPEERAFYELWDGLDALREEELRTQFSSWQEAWAEADEGELMEAYWEDQLNVNARDAMSMRADRDADFAETLRKQGLLSRSLNAAAEENFRRQLEGWTDSDTASAPARVVPLRRRAMRWAAAAAACLLLGWVGLRGYADANYSNAALTRSAYQAPNLGATLGGEAPATGLSPEEQLNQAHEAMKRQDYAAATQGFSSLLAALPTLPVDELTRKNLYQNAEWNLLLAELGQDQTGPDWAQRLAAIAHSPEHPYADKAAQLEQQLNSFWRWWGQ